MGVKNFTGSLPNFVGGFCGFTVSAEIPGILWNLNTYKLRGQFSVGTETAPTGMWFKPDGSKLYITGQTRDRIRSWDLTTAWDITSATGLTEMASSLLDTGGVALTGPTGLSFSDDGLYAFIVDAANNALYRYNLTVAWDITTLNTTASQANTTIYATNTGPQSIWVKDDGLTFLTANASGTQVFRVLTSTIANDITSLTLSSSVSAGSNIPIGANWVDNGLKMVYVYQSTDVMHINGYTPAYRFSTGTNLYTRTMTTQDTTPQDVYMTNDGSRFYYLGSATDTIFQFTL